MRLADKVCLITGAGSGIGRASALMFATEGATVAVADIDLMEILKKHQLTGELGEPEDVAAAALYLASDESRFVLGSGLAVDGGVRGTK